MPTYDFEDTKTGKQWTDMMSIADKEKYLKKNKHIKQMVSAINIVGGVQGMGSYKNDQGWAENMSRIAEAHPTSNLGQRYGKPSIKDVKTQQVIKKHAARRVAKLKG
jgi:predicted nucleic acid-binding Zn ribbon protein